MSCFDRLIEAYRQSQVKFSLLNKILAVCEFIGIMDTTEPLKPDLPGYDRADPVLAHRMLNGSLACDWKPFEPCQPALKQAKN